MKHSFKEWMIAVRPWSFPASAMPVLVTLAFLNYAGYEMNWWYGVWALLNIVVFHAAGNTWSDYFDYKKGVDREDTFGAKTLTDGMFTPKEIYRLSLGLLVNPHEMIDVAGVALLIALFMIIVARPVSVFACLLPFRKMTNRARAFVSWVGLRGAVPIIFATYPVVAGIPDSNQLFNIVFFITLLSLVFQGMTIAKGARMLHLDLPQEKEGNEFGVELPDEIDSQLMDQTLTAEMLAGGNRLMDMNIPKGTLVMLVKRGNEFIIPNGQVELKEGDKLLYISEKKDA